MKKLVLTLSAGMVCLLLGGNPLQAQNRQQAPAALHNDLRLAAQTSGLVLLGSLADVDLPDYGFASRKEANKATVGEPIEIINQYLDIERGTIETASAHEYYVPLMINGVARVFLTVSTENGGYEVVGIGDMTLARDAAPFINGATAAGAQKMVWLRNLNHQADFIAVAGASKEDATVYTPLFTAQRAGFQSSVPYHQLAAKMKTKLVQFD